MTAALVAILAMMQQAIPLATAASSGAGLIASIIKALTAWLPIIMSEIKSLYPIVKNIITELQSKTDILTDDQKTTLQTIDAQTDAAFELATQGLDPDADA